MAIAHLDPRRLARAKDAYATRRVPRELLTNITDARRVPRAGDLVLARVERVGRKGALRDLAGRRADLVPGDEIVVAYGSPAAPERSGAVVPDDLGPCHLVADVGLVARVRFRDAAATEIAPIGLLADHDGRPVNLADWVSPATEPIVAGRSVVAPDHGRGGEEAPDPARFRRPPKAGWGRTIVGA